MSDLKYTLKDDETKQLVTEMYQTGHSGRQIGLTLGIAPRTIQEFLKKDTHAEWWRLNGDVVKIPTSETKKENIHAKILFLDIETSPLAGAVWGLWNNNISLSMIERDWYILSYCAKWYHEDEVYYKDKSASWDTEDDIEILEEVWQLLDECDILVTQNGKAFDEKKLNARFILNGMKPPSHYRSIDTLEIAKKHFRFTSNKLEYMTHALNKRYKKLNHGKFAGFELWKECMKGNPEAWEEMCEYNIHDVLALEELYEILRPWYKGHPNLNLYHNENYSYCSCGNDEFEHNGYHVTNLSKFDKFVCTNCGAEVRGRVNLLIKDKRESLRSNII